MTYMETATVTYFSHVFHILGPVGPKGRALAQGPLKHDMNVNTYLKVAIFTHTHIYIYIYIVAYVSHCGRLVTEPRMIRMIE